VAPVEIRRGRGRPRLARPVTP